MLLLSSADIFKVNFFKIFPQKLTECQIVWSQIRTDILGPDLGPKLFAKVIVPAGKGNTKSKIQPALGLCCSYITKEDIMMTLSMFHHTQNLLVFQ